MQQFRSHAPLTCSQKTSNRSPLSGPCTKISQTAAICANYMYMTYRYAIANATPQHTLWISSNYSKRLIYSKQTTDEMWTDVR